MQILDRKITGQAATGVENQFYNMQGCQLELKEHGMKSSYELWI